MKKRNSNFIMENTKNQWVKLIMQEKGYTEITATWMSNRIEALINHMQYVPLDGLHLHLVGFGAFGWKNILALEVAVHHDDGIPP